MYPLDVPQNVTSPPYPKHAPRSLISGGQTKKGLNQVLLATRTVNKMQYFPSKGYGYSYLGASTDSLLTVYSYFK